jgi:hypothetical protein
MFDSIESVKNRVRKAFLGKAGIHGIGLSRAEKAIRVYLTRQAGAEQGEVLAQLRISAEPYRIIVVEEEKPSIASQDDSA